MWKMDRAAYLRATSRRLYLFDAKNRLIFMKFRLSKEVFISIASALFALDICAQDPGPYTCFNAEEIHFPLANNDFSKSEVLFNDKMYNALYYLYQDKYSFWYKFVADKDIEIEFSVSPSNKSDRYRAVVFKYSEGDFCERLVNENLPLHPTNRKPIFLPDGTIIYRNTISAIAGDIYYVSVLSLNRDDCGHFFHMKSEGQQLSINAVHRPCYDFTVLEVPDFGTTQMDLLDIELDLTFPEKEETAPVVEEATTPTPAKEDLTGFKALTTIEIESSEDGLVSVGDKLILNQVFFYTNTYAFKAGSEEELDQLYSFLNSNPSVQIEIQGHTANNTKEIIPDPNFKGQGKEWSFKGSAMELSQKRAEAVAAYLIAEGISKKRLKAAGYGDTQKRLPNAQSFEDAEKNMRVEALVTKQ